MSAAELSYFEKEFPYDPDYAQNPHLLVGKRVVVGGLGKGLVLEFHKVFSLFYDSTHTIDFKADIGIRKVLLRRKKGLKFNSGLYFRVMSEEEARLEKENEGKAELTALKDQLAAVEQALRSTVSEHENQISQLQETHERELVSTELRMSMITQESHSINSLAQRPSLIAEGDEDEELTSALKIARESALRAERAEFLEAQAKGKVAELEQKVQKWKEKLEQSELESTFVSPYERMASDKVETDGEKSSVDGVSSPTSSNNDDVKNPLASESPGSDTSLVESSQETFIKEMVTNLEEQLVHARKKADNETQARELAVYDAAEAAKMVPKSSGPPAVKLDPFEVAVVSTVNNTVNTLNNIATVAVTETTSNLATAGYMTGNLVTGMTDALTRSIGITNESSDGDDDNDVFNGQSGIKKLDNNVLLPGSKEAILRREHAELQAAAEKQKAEVKRLETLAQSEDAIVEQHEVVVNKMEAMATQLSSVETELKQTIAEKEFLYQQLMEKANAAKVNDEKPKPVPTPPVEGGVDGEENDDDDDAFAAASAALAEAEATSKEAQSLETAKAMEEAAALRKEVAELKAAAMAASAASSALRFELQDNQASLNIRKHESAQKESLHHLPPDVISTDDSNKSSINDPSVKVSLDEKFEKDDDKNVAVKKDLPDNDDENFNPLLFGVDQPDDDKGEAKKPTTAVESEDTNKKEEDDITIQLSIENEKLRQQLRELEARNERLLHDTEAVTSVVEHASDYERMIAATEKFHRDVVGIRGFSTSRYGLSLGRGDSLSQARSDFDSSDSLVGDDEYHRNPSFLRDPEVTEFERFSMATNAFHALNQRSNDDVISGDDVTSPGGADGEDAPRIRSFPFAAQSPDPDEIPRNFPVHDDDDVAGINLWPQDDFREKSLNRVAALNKDANALEQDKKHVDECEAEFNKALRAMNEKVEKGERSADDDVDEEVSRLATKLAEARQNYQQSEEKLHRDVEELKKSVVGATDESNPQVDQLKRATLEFQQSMEPLRDRSMTRQQAASSSPAAAAANRSKSGDVTPVKSKRPPAVKSNKKNVAKTPVREPRATPSAKKAAPTATTEAETDESLTFM